MALLNLAEEVVAEAVAPVSSPGGCGDTVARTPSARPMESTEERVEVGSGTPSV